ncbi:MAG: tyrosine-protein phosphatase [Streptosporangiaceae bacterium]
MADPRRRIELAGVFNLRDVGGYPVQGGGSVRWRTLFRSDALHRLDPAGVAAVTGLGLRSVIDLRTQPEVDLAPSPVGGRVTHVPVMGDLQVLPAELGGIYRYFVDECGGQIAAAVAELSGGDAVPALVHCSVGKDRTGVVIALILAVLGVPDEVIAADDALSGSYLDPSRTPVIGQLQVSTGLGAELTSALLSSPPELMFDVLDMIRERGGSVDGYLRGHGLTDAALGRLRAALIV